MSHPQAETNGVCRIEQNRELLSDARKALDELATSLIKSRSSGTFGIVLVIYEGRLTQIRQQSELNMNRRT